MDANGLSFWNLADEGDWEIQDGLVYDAGRHSLCLESVSERLPPGPCPQHPAVPTAADRRNKVTPQARDGFGTRAYWSASAKQVVAIGALPTEVPILALPDGEEPSDLAMGYDGVLYIALASGDLVLQDRRGRWSPVRFHKEGFKAWRLAADPAGGVWVLDRKNRQLALFEGLPLANRPAAPGISRQCRENPHPPRMTVLKTPIGNGARVGVACSPEGRIAVVSSYAAEDQVVLRLLPAGPGAAREGLTPDSTLGPALSLVGAAGAYSLAWVSGGLLALLLAHVSAEAPVYPVDQVRPGDELRPIGDLYPLPGHNGGPFLHGLDTPPHYPTRDAPGSLPLYHLSQPSFAAEGTAGAATQESKDADDTERTWSRLDSGNCRTVWHRLYLEADLPPECGVRVRLAAGDTPEPPADGSPDWFAHDFGACPDDRASPQAPAHPRGAWVPAASELPFHSGLLKCPSVTNRSGLFTALIQRGDRRVRTLRGRYLHAQVILYGNRRSTPEIAALRAYASRFSYAEHYLPELYRENCFGPEADDVVGDEAQQSTPADFLERFLDNFEGILTPLEDRIAGAYLLTDPRSAPEDALEWLGSWIGMAFDPALPAKRRREMIQHAPWLYKHHGTVPGLCCALDLATDHAVSGGEVVVIEDFRLRRTFATILGADFTEEDDPLVPGLMVSGNSFVGDTLFLGDEHRQEFMALYSADVQALSMADALRLSPAQAQMLASAPKAVSDLYDRLAHRVTVLVHQEVEPQDLALIRRVVDLETPAHVRAQVLTATWPFLVGVASLVGIDTYLGIKPAQLPVRVDVSRIGVRDLLLHPASLDPRLEGGAYPGAQDLGGELLTIDLGDGL